VIVAVVYMQFTGEITERLSADISFIDGAMLRQNPVSETLCFEI
jgi:hypothetical protein